MVEKTRVRGKTSSSSCSAGMQIHMCSVINKGDKHNISSYWSAHKKHELLTTQSGPCRFILQGDCKVSTLCLMAVFPKRKAVLQQYLHAILFSMIPTQAPAFCTLCCNLEDRDFRTFP